MSIHSIYDLQYFNCPECVFKNNSKQEFINHAYKVHPDCVYYLDKIDDNSLIDIFCPWLTPQIKSEEPDEAFIISTENTLDPIKMEVTNSDKFEICKNEFRYENNDITQKCELCSQIFLNKAKLKKHIKVIHEGKKYHKCKSCNNEFGYLRSLNFHIKTIHEEQKEDFKCVICNKKLSSKHRLQYHIKTMHNGQRNHKCETCHKAFAESGTLKLHIKTVHER